jgi:hypothetical protein
LFAFFSARNGLGKERYLNSENKKNRPLTINTIDAKAAISRGLETLPTNEPALPRLVSAIFSKPAKTSMVTPANAVITATKHVAKEIIVSFFQASRVELTRLF